MSNDTHSAAPENQIAYDPLGLRGHWGERVVTAVAVSTAVLLVATVAVLMGMA
jgi:hypothetical protein